MEPTPKAEEVTSRAALLGRAEYIMQYADSIFVRVEIEGRWQTRALAELPAPLLMREFTRLLVRPADPVRVLPKEPGNANS